MIERESAFQICFVYETLIGELILSTRLWLFMCFQWFVFVFMALVQVGVPDVPEDIHLQLERTAFISKKV